MSKIEQTTNFFNQMNPVLKFFIQIGAVLGVVITIIFYPVKASIREVQKEVQIIKDDQIAYRTKVEKDLEKKMNTDLIEAKLYPLGQNIERIEKKVDQISEFLIKNHSKGVR